MLALLDSKQPASSPCSQRLACSAASSPNVRLREPLIEPAVGVDDLPPEVLHLVLAQLDALALLRAARTCHTLNAGSDACDLWLPHLFAFFDNEPPPTELLLDGRPWSHPRDVLREHLAFARAADRLATQQQWFFVCSHHEFAPTTTPPWRRATGCGGRPADYWQWRLAIDAKVAASQGRSSALYPSDLDVVIEQVRAYGRYHRLCATHCAPHFAADAGVSASAATFIKWRKLEWSHVATDAQVRTPLSMMELENPIHDVTVYASLTQWLSKSVTDAEVALSVRQKRTCKWRPSPCDAKHIARVIARLQPAHTMFVGGPNTSWAYTVKTFDCETEYYPATHEPTEAQLNVLKLIGGPYAGILEFEFRMQMRCFDDERSPDHILSQHHLNCTLDGSSMRISVV
jgi:hypothetical protein